MKSICVFCGSSTGADPVHADVTRKLGIAMAKQGISLVYGGGNIGLMGVLADTVLSEGGKVLGVIPGFLKDKEVCHTGLTELIVTQTMHQRKWIMEERSDAVIVLPGGFGTLDEFFEILTWKQLGLHQKPIGILNVDGFYDPLLDHVSNMATAGFLRNDNLSLFVVEDRIEPLLKRMRNITDDTPVGKWME